MKNCLFCGKRLKDIFKRPDEKFNRNWYCSEICQEAYRKERKIKPIRSKKYNYCKKCGNQMSYYTHPQLCESCKRKRREKLKEKKKQFFTK